MPRRQCQSTVIAIIDREIDELVYRLYGLSKEEIKVVEVIIDRTMGMLA